MGIVVSEYFGAISIPVFCSISIFALFVVGFFNKLNLQISFLLFFAFFGGNFVNESNKSSTKINSLLPYKTKLEGQIVVDEVLKQTVQKSSFIVNVKDQKVLFYYADSTQFVIPGDTFLLKNISISPLNLLDSTDTYFKYNLYLQSRGVIGIVFLKSKNIVFKKQSSEWLAKIYSFRCQLCKVIIQHKVFKANELGVFLSLILGERSYLPFELKTDYQVSGLIHVLAISGLHIGVLYLFIKYLLNFLHIRNPKRQFVIVFVVLTLYALVAGLSPSVVRAVVMCIMIQLGNVIQEKSKILNTVLTSALFLLIYKPQWLWDIGFQLSYLAVVFMVILLPVFKNYFKESKWLLQEKIKELLWVNITASIGTFPILSYHFGIVYFGAILSGMVIVPFSSIAVIFGIASLAFYKNYNFFHFLLELNNYLLLWMNQMIHGVNKLLIPQLKYQCNLAFVLCFFTFVLVFFHPRLKLIPKIIFMALTLIVAGFFML